MGCDLRKRRIGAMGSCCYRCIRSSSSRTLYDGGEYTVQQIADIFGVPRTTVYGHLDQSTIGSRPGALTTANGNG